MCARLGSRRGEGGGGPGDPICLFCPPDVSESRLRDLALGVQGGQEDWQT